MTPDEFTLKELHLKTSGSHSIYVQDWGNKNAKLPILFLHGGPGNGCNDNDKRKFDPNTERVIFHDQRGSGNSTPLGSIVNNKTSDLIDDIEMIRKTLKLKEFIIVGGSWGTTLALLYTIAHPESVKGLVLDGIYTATEAENEWFNDDLWQIFYPDVWEEYQLSVPASYRSHPTRYHMEEALGSDEEKAKLSAYKYLESKLALLKLDDIYTPVPYEKFDPSAIRAEIHYLSNGCFIPEGFILRNTDKLTQPVKIIQGRYDMVCPPTAAYSLSQKLDNSELVWTINGHLRGHEAKNLQRVFINELLEK